MWVWWVIDEAVARKREPTYDRELRRKPTLIFKHLHYAALTMMYVIDLMAAP